MSNRLYAVRGAVCAKDTPESIAAAVSELYTQLKSRNSFTEEDLVSIQFTVTGDLVSLNPAAALRRSCGVSSVPLFCSLEPAAAGALDHVVRILITGYMPQKPVPVYIGGAEILRPDISAAGDGRTHL
ncbi:MAG: chorismate mutase [Bacteroides sp.]|nr:chorismate mutase [Prevotella sp.]MCM1407935.1 chorismate mutase [Treponema brennaborense]MCM1469677.1 chorismate mutase [Bacteroides sp.]